MTFIAIDFETAHAQFPCEIGLAFVNNGKITDTKSWLIKPACFPYMNPWNQKVHGISSAELVNAPTFDELWNELKIYIQDQLIVAHNAAFDMGVLRASLAHYDLAIPDADYFCSVSLSRKKWKNLSSYSLGSLCQMYNIKFRHHRAGDDASACAQLVLNAFENTSELDLYSSLTDFGVKINSLRK